MRDETSAAHESTTAEAGKSAHFADTLHAAIACAGTPACVGLDPVLEKIPHAVGGVSGGHEGKGKPIGAADRLEAFCAGIIEAVAGIVPIVKPQSACFERFGQAGVGVLKRTIQLAHARGLLVILDAKRGDIGTTAEHYAAAAFGTEKTSRLQAADAVTLNGYMGMETVEPFLGTGTSAGARGAFVLVRTSNPGSDSIQAQRLADGRTVAELVAEEVAVLGRTPGRIGVCGLSCVGAVVGATKSAEGVALRRRMPEQVFLVPGYGAQGGTLDDLRPLLRSTSSPADSGVVVNASRSVIYAPKLTSADWIGEVRAAARTFADELRSLFA